MGGGRRPEGGHFPPSPQKRGVCLPRSGPGVGWGWASWGWAEKDALRRPRKNRGWGEAAGPGPGTAQPALQREGPGAEGGPAFPGGDHRSWGLAGRGLRQRAHPVYQEVHVGFSGGGGASASLSQSPGRGPAKKGRGVEGEEQGLGHSGYREGNGAGSPPAPRHGVRWGGRLSVQARHPPARRAGGGAGRGAEVPPAASSRPPRAARTPAPTADPVSGGGEPRPRRKGAPERLGPESGGRRRAEAGSPAPATPSRAGGRAGPLPAQPALGVLAGRGRGAAETLTRSAGVAPSSPAALGRSRRPGGAGPAAPAGPPAPRGSARLRRRQLPPRERPGPRGHLPPAGRGRRTCGRAGGRGLRAPGGRAGGWTALGAPLPARPAAAVPERARPPRIPSLGGAAPPSGRAGSGAGPGRAASAGRSRPRGLRALRRRCPRSPTPAPGRRGRLQRGLTRQPGPGGPGQVPRGREQQVPR